MRHTRAFCWSPWTQVLCSAAVVAQGKENDWHDDDDGGDVFYLSNKCFFFKTMCSMGNYSRYVNAAVAECE